MNNAAKLPTEVIESLTRKLVPTKTPRDSLFAGVHPELKASIPLSRCPWDQTLRDLDRLNHHSVLDDGTYPLATYLRNLWECLQPTSEGPRPPEVEQLREPVRQAFDMLGLTQTPELVSVADHPYPPLHKNWPPLRDVLASAYNQPGQIKSVLTRQPTNLVGAVNLQGSPNEIWTSVAVEAAKIKAFRAVLNTILADPDAESLHTAIRDLMVPTIAYVFGR
ncbi:MAG: hypothetical protein IPK82_39695 [Polyangiaceae bacterium]|nr:hypothetical protein [Polyangiaceae bacterium]